MNHVLLVGRIEQDPESRTNSDGKVCVLRLAVRRRRPGGGIEPGISYLEVLVPWPPARECSELRKGELVAVSGLVERNEFRDSDGRWQRRQEIVADWIERL